MFTTDRDLLTLEPTLFRDISWLAQTLALGTGSLSGGTLTLDDPLLAGIGVAAGHVVMVDRIPLEVLSITGDGPDAPLMSARFWARSIRVWISSDAAIIVSIVKLVARVRARPYRRRGRGRLAQTRWRAREGERRRLSSNLDTVS
jgi:hypothetical protein